MTLNIPCHITPKYKDLFTGAQRFADRINELGKGRVEANLYHSGKLLKVKEIVPALMKGGCEIIFHSSTHTTGHWPEIGGLALPFLYEDERDCQKHWTAGVPLFNLVNKEMGRKYGVRVLASGILKGLMIATREKALEKPEDLNGLTIRVSGETDTEFVKACGATPIFLSSSEASKALRHGAIDGLVTYPGTLAARNLDDVLGYFIDMKPILSAWGYQIYVLNKTFDSWPSEVREIIAQAAKEYDQHYLENSLEYYRQHIAPKLEKKMKFISPSSKQMNRFVEVARQTYDAWAKSVDSEFAKKFIELSQMP